MKQKLGLMLLGYLKTIAKLQLRKYSPDIVGISGSAGKTTTRNAVAAILQEKYRTKVSEKANSESGIPLNILNLEPHDYSILDWIRLALLAPIQLVSNWNPYDKYVVEMGIDSPRPPKNMEYLLTIVHPRTAILLNALPVHSHAFDEYVTKKDPAARTTEVRKLIAQEKGKMITTLPANGLAILNADDPYVMALADKTDAQVMTFGKAADATVVIREIHYTSLKTNFTFTTHEGLLHLQFAYLLPEHYAYSLAAAICVGLDEGMSNQEIADLLQRNFQLEPGRMSLFHGVNGSTLIDSSYNASAEPTIEALQMMSALPAHRKIALLGDMRELGEETQSEHERVMATVIRTCDLAVLVGPSMKQYALPYLKKQGYTAVEWFDTAVKAGAWLRSSLTEGDMVLIKGSQNTIYLETAVEVLLADLTDVDFLCRRGDYWNRIRNRYFHPTQA